MTTDSGTSYEFTVGDHNEQMHEYISDLIDEAYRRKKGGGNGNEAGEGVIPEPTTPQERVSKADKLCEDYYVQVGAKPSSGALSRLAWYVIFDDMTDSHPDKVSRTEYPIMSGWQKELRNERFVKIEKLTQGKEDAGIVRIPLDLSLQEALGGAGLTKRQREAVELVFLMDMTQAGAATVMGIRKPAVNKHVSIGIRKLRKYKGDGIGESSKGLVSVC